LHLQEATGPVRNFVRVHPSQSAVRPQLSRLFKVGSAERLRAGQTRANPAPRPQPKTRAGRSLAARRRRFIGPNARSFSETGTIAFPFWTCIATLWRSCWIQLSRPSIENSEKKRKSKNAQQGTSLPETHHSLYVLPLFYSLAQLDGCRVFLPCPFLTMTEEQTVDVCTGLGLGPATTPLLQEKPPRLLITIF